MYQRKSTIALPVNLVPQLDLQKDVTCCISYYVLLCYVICSLNMLYTRRCRLLFWKISRECNPGGSLESIFPIPSGQIR